MLVNPDLILHEGPSGAVAFSPDGKLIAWGDNLGFNIEVYDLAGRRPITTMAGHQEMVNALVFAPHSGLLVSGAGDNSVRLWDINTGREIKCLAAHRDEVRDVALSPDGQILATISADGTAMLWEMGTWQRLRSAMLNLGVLNRVAFSLDNRWLACGGEGGVAIWDFVKGADVSTSQIGDVNAVAFSPVRPWLALAEQEEIAIWEYTNSWEKRVLLDAREETIGLAFSSDGRYLASGGQEGHVRLWGTNTWEVRQILAGHPAIGAPASTAPRPLLMVIDVAICPAGIWLASAGFGGVRVWSLNRLTS